MNDGEGFLGLTLGQSSLVQGRCDLTHVPDMGGVMWRVVSVEFAKTIVGVSMREVVS